MVAAHGKRVRILNREFPEIQMRHQDNGIRSAVAESVTCLPFNLEQEFFVQFCCKKTKINANYLFLLYNFSMNYPAIRS